MTCPTCGNAHSDECSTAALKARIDVESTMVVTLTGQVAAWEEIAAQHARNEDYYRGLLDEVAGSLGVDAFTADDGSVSESPLRAKVPELVRAMAATCTTLRAQLATAREEVSASYDRGMQAGDETYERQIEELRAQLTASQALAGDLRARLIPALDAAGVDYDAEPGTLARVIGDRERATDVMVGEVNRVRVPFADRQRLLDLVRHQRGPLHDAGLISDEEYAALAGDYDAVARLEGYDEARAKLAEAKATIARLTWLAH